MADAYSSSNPLLAHFDIPPFDHVEPVQLSVSSIPPRFMPIPRHRQRVPPPSATSPPTILYIRRPHLLSQSQIDPAARTHANRCHQQRVFNPERSATTTSTTPVHPPNPPIRSPLPSTTSRHAWRWPNPTRRPLRWPNLTHRRRGHPPRGAPRLRGQRLATRRRRGSAAAAPPRSYLQGRAAAVGRLQELGPRPACLDQAGQRPPCHPHHLGHVQESEEERQRGVGAGRDRRDAGCVRRRPQALRFLNPPYIP